MLKREIVESDIPRLHELVKKASRNQNEGVIGGGTFNPDKPAGSLNYDPDATISDIERLGGITNHF